MRGEIEPDATQAVPVSADWIGIPVLDRTGAGAKVELEERHWWYRGRRRIILDALRRLDLPADTAILDAGCGTGSMLAGLARYGQVTAVDVNPEAVVQARRRMGSEVLLGPLTPLSLGDRQFDAVTCLDVLEHVPDDRAALVELFRVTRPGGALLLTAPAYPGLWSAHDVAAGHRRRYRRSELVSLAEQVGWEPVVHTHFNALLLPAAALWRRFRRHTSRISSDLLATDPRFNRLLEIPLRGEAWWLARGHRIAWGLSILAVFTRPAGDQ